MSPEQEEKLREVYRKNLLQAILLPPEAVESECPELVARCREAARSRKETTKPKRDG